MIADWLHGVQLHPAMYDATLLAEGRVEMNTKRTSNLMEALRTGAECWEPVREGAKVFNVYDKDGKAVCVTGILDDTREQPGSTGYYLGLFFDNFEQRITDFARIPPHAIHEALENKQYTVVRRVQQLVAP